MIVVQYSDISNDPLLCLTEAYHRQFCKLHDYEYRLITKPIDPNRHVFWQKPLVFQKLQQEGHSNIVWLDTDALWLGEPLTPTFHRIGATLCWHYENRDHHHNVGVFYINDFIFDILDKWLAEPDDGHPWADNWAFKKLVDRNEIQVTTLGPEWNSFMYYPIYRYNGTPKVAAWHGNHKGHNKFKLMSEYIQRNLK
jgi:hypothetical protein